ncbi:MAG: response regulator [Bacteroidota bacterium]
MAVIPSSSFTVLLGLGHPDNRNELYEMFGEKEFNILTARSSEEILDKFREHPEIALVILATELAGSNGFEVLKKVKSLKDNIPVFLLSAYISLESLKLASISGCDEFLQAPVREKELLSLINKHLLKQLKQSI